jgi:hypothetical protein
MFHIYNFNCQEADGVHEMSARHPKRHKPIVVVVVDVDVVI